jgi:hypothetical protein
LGSIWTRSRSELAWRSAMCEEGRIRGSATHGSIKSALRRSELGSINETREASGGNEETIEDVVLGPAERE